MSGGMERTMDAWLELFLDRTMDRKPGIRLNDG